MRSEFYGLKGSEQRFRYWASPQRKVMGCADIGDVEAKEAESL